MKLVVIRKPTLVTFGAKGLRFFVSLRRGDAFAR